MKILMVSPFSAGAASTKRILNFAKNLSEKNEITIIIPNYDIHSNYRKLIEKDKKNIKIIHPYYPKIKTANLYAYLYMLSSSISALKQKFDIIYALKASPLSISGIFAKMIYNKPLILDVDDLESEVIKEQKGKGIIYAFSKYFEKMMPKKAEEIIVVSSYLENYMKNEIKLNDKNITLIPNGVNSNYFSLKKKKNDKTKITYIGTLNKKDQIILSLDLIKEIKKLDKNISCSIIGDGKYKSELEEYSKKIGIEDVTQFYGRLDYTKIPLILSQSDLGLCFFPTKKSLIAASNVKIFEYMAAGVIPIVSNNGDLNNYIENGKAGIIGNIKDLKETAKDIVKIINDKEKMIVLSNNAKKRVKKNYDWEILSNKLQGVINNVK